jgi:hypothetical protein
MMLLMQSRRSITSSALLIGALLLAAGVLAADEPPGNPDATPAVTVEAVAPDAEGGQVVEANVGRGGGVARLPAGVSCALLPGSAAEEPGWHRLRLEIAEPLLPQPEAVGTRPIDRRSSGPLGQVEGPPVVLGSGLRLRLVDPDPSEEIGTGMVDPDDWPPWLASVPDDLMPLLPPEQAALRKGFLVVVPGASPEGVKERLSTWLYSPGGMRRQPARPGAKQGELEAWDPCLKLGRIDAVGAAWFYLPELTCGLEEDPVWTPLREQSQQEFAAWVLEQSPAEQNKELRRELKQMARDEVKAEKEL